MKRFIILVLKFVAGVLLTALTLFTLFSISPIYDFEKPKPFEGPDIFNPYANLDTTIGWKRANFHTHTKVTGWFNESDYWPDEVLRYYRDFDYYIVTFSNHNELTIHPTDPRLQVNVYEHGYSLFKYHKLVFGCQKVWYFDNFLPFLTSQRQWQMDVLGRQSDFIQLNHPFRTNFTTRRIMENLSGYRITELDSGVSTEQDYWDWSLSTGYYTFGLANDDLHNPGRTDLFAIRCNWLNINDDTYEAIKQKLLEGTYYSMRVPDFGNGDWDVKRRKNAELPRISDIGLRGDTVYLCLSRPARVKVYGQDHVVKAQHENADTVLYVMESGEHYIRFQAHYDDGTIIYTNPFARYDASKAESPYHPKEHTVNWPLTVLFNAALLLLAFCWVWLFVKMCRHRVKTTRR